MVVEIVDGGVTVEGMGMMTEGGRGGNWWVMNDNYTTV